MLTGKIEGTDNLTVISTSSVKICASFSGLYVCSNKITVFRPFHFILLVHFHFGEVQFSENFISGDFVNGGELYVTCKTKCYYAKRYSI